MSGIPIAHLVCALSLRYTDPDMERPFRVGKRGNFLLWCMAIITISVWGYAAFGCIALSNQIADAVILLLGIPIYGFYRWRPVKQQ
jgi:hypothetical protein